jgi:uncharacterized protein YceH (UPF0502 family)
VFGSGKLPRYRHLAYEWLGVGKEELGIMGELLLRGEQTEGDLRGRASRMDPIPDLDTLRVHLDRLAERGLVIWLSPPGRGRMLTHGLLPEEKLEKVRTQVGLSAGAFGHAAASHRPKGDEEAEAASEIRADRGAGGGTASAALADRVASLEQQLAQVLERLAALEDGDGAG